ncbi:AAA family ATPase [Agromyces sp. NPDC058110]|uniref:AAA family ATPase n=1 Tax=Agromyces sp. NPDC058110 TaxID=3346345 RepID=UPI0036DA4043
MEPTPVNPAEQHRDDEAPGAADAVEPGASVQRVRQLRLVVHAADFERALAFYRDALGMAEQEAYDGDGGAMVRILDAGRATLELSNPAQVAFIDRVEAEGRPSDRLRVALEVDDGRAVTAELVAAGAELEAESRETPWRSVNSRLRGPAGLQLTLFQELDAAEPAPVPTGLDPTDADDTSHARNAPGAVIVVTGPSGSGKSTVGALIAERSGRPAVHLETDGFYSAIRSGAVAPHLPAAQRQNEVVIATIAASAASWAAGGYDVVVDGVVGPWFLAPIVDAARGVGAPLHYVVLRPSADVAVERATARSADALRDEAVVRDLHGQFADLGALEPHALDTTHLDVERTVEAVRAVVDGGAMRLA